jgi:hypothetical protein
MGGGGSGKVKVIRGDWGKGSEGSLHGSAEEILLAEGDQEFQGPI